MKQQNKKTIFATLIILFLLSIFYFININNFINGSEINSPWIDGNILYQSNKYLGLLSITLGFIGGLLGTVSIIYLIYEYKWYWILTIIGQSLTIIDSVITGVLLTAISYTILIGLLVTINTTSMKEIKDKWLILSWVLFIIFGLILYLIIFEQIITLNIIDSFCGGLSIYGWYHIANQNKRGYILFIINDLIYILVFIWIGLIVVAMSFVIYGLINTYCLYELISKE